MGAGRGSRLPKGVIRRAVKTQGKHLNIVINKDGKVPSVCMLTGED